MPRRPDRRRRDGRRDCRCGDRMHSRVARMRYRIPAPSEPDLTVSRHPAQASATIRGPDDPVPEMPDSHLIGGCLSVCSVYTVQRLQQ
jgi:hypothetical protein